MAALLHALARDVAAGRRVERLTDPGLATWMRFRGRLTVNDFVALLFEDARVLHQIPLDPAVMGDALRVDRIQEVIVKRWIESVPTLELRVFPFQKFPGVPVYPGPEMRSTGEVMGLSYRLGNAFAKAFEGTGMRPPTEGAVLISVNDYDKLNTVGIARDFHELGFEIRATAGTAETLRANGIPTRTASKVNEGSPNVVQEIESGEIVLIVNTPLGKTSRYDECAIGEAALQHGVAMITTLSGARAAVRGIRFLKTGDRTVRSLQEYHASRMSQGGGRGPQS